MSETAEKLLAEIAKLPPEEQADIAHSLLRSLDDAEEDVETDPAWDAELERRFAEMESAKDPGIPAEEVFARLRK